MIKRAAFWWFRTNPIFQLTVAAAFVAAAMGLLWVTS